MKLVAKSNARVSSAAIEFNSEELEFLAALVQRIGGKPEGVRGNADKLLNMLEKLGYHLDNVRETKAYVHMEGSIRFND